MDVRFDESAFAAGAVAAHEVVRSRFVAGDVPSLAHVLSPDLLKRLAGTARSAEAAREEFKGRAGEEGTSAHARVRAHAGV